MERNKYKTSGAVTDEDVQLARVTALMSGEDACAICRYYKRGSPWGCVSSDQASYEVAPYFVCSVFEMDKPT